MNHLSHALGVHWNINRHNIYESSMVLNQVFALHPLSLPITHPLKQVLHVRNELPIVLKLLGDIFFPPL